MHFGTPLLDTDVLLFYLLLLHFSRKALGVHDDLELELIEVIETFDLAIKQLLDFVSLFITWCWICHFTLNVRPDILDRHDFIFDQEGRKIEKTLVGGIELLFCQVFTGQLVAGTDSCR